MSFTAGSVSADLTGQVALVTGGGRGIGRACAQALAAAGGAVAVVARSTAQLAETVRNIQAAGGQAIALPTDVTDAQAVAQMVHAVERQLGPIDLLLNNAAVPGPVGPVQDVDPDEWWRCLDVIVRGPFLCTRVILPGMLARRRGRIINVASTGGLRPIPYFSAYTAAKAALIRFTETLAAETKAAGLSVFAIHPGVVRTAAAEYLLESVEGRQYLSWFRGIFEAGQDVPPEQAARLVVWLAAGHADGLTGRFLNVADDVTQFVERQEAIEREDLYTMRLRVPPA